MQSYMIEGNVINERSSRYINQREQYGDRVILFVCAYGHEYYYK